MNELNGNAIDLMIRLEDAIGRYPDLIGRGSMHGFPEEATLKLLVVLAGIVPIDYREGNLDSNTCDAMMDAIGFIIDDHIGSTDKMSDIAKADLELYCHELIETAIDIRFLIPLKAVHFHFITRYRNAIIIKAQFTPWD